MTMRHRDGGEDAPDGAAAARGAQPDDADLRERSLLEFIPRRNLWKALIMLMVLIALVTLQRRGSSIVKVFTDVMIDDPAPAAAPPSPPEKEAP